MWRRKNFPDVNATAWWFMNGAILASNLHLSVGLKRKSGLQKNRYGQQRIRVKENAVNCLAHGVFKKYSRETVGGNGTASSFKIEAGIGHMLIEFWSANLLN
jgi:hypothetical protein